MSMADEHHADRRSLPGLLTRLVDQVTTLAQQEARLARSEIGDAVSRIAASAMTIVIAAALIISGLVVLLQAAVIALEMYGFGPIEPGVDPHPDVDLKPPIAVNQVLVGTEVLNNVQSRQHHALRVVLMGHRCAKERQDRIPHQSRNRAFVFEDRTDHLLKRAVHDLGPVLGIHLLSRGGGALDITEEHRDDPALTLHRAI